MADTSFSHNVVKMIGLVRAVAEFAPGAVRDLTALLDAWTPDDNEQFLQWVDAHPECREQMEKVLALSLAMIYAYDPDEALATLEELQHENP